MENTTNCERTATDETLLDFDAMDISADLEAIGNVNGLAVVSLAAHDAMVRAHVRRERWLALALAAAIIAAVCAACI